MKFRKALALLLAACLLVSTAVVAFSASTPAAGYYFYEQEYSSTKFTENDNRAICGFTVDTAASKLKYQKQNANDPAARVIINDDKGLTVGKAYRVTVDFDITTPDTKYLSFRLLGSNQVGDVYNAHSLDTANICKGPNGTDLQLSGALKTAGQHTYSYTAVATQPTMGFYLSQNDAVFSIDKVTVQEVFELSTTVNNTEGGTAKVQNKNQSLYGFAVGEYATFTAEPAEGYLFAGWYKDGTLQSKLATYEPTDAVTAAYSLEARFTVDNGEGAKITYGYEDTESPYNYTADQQYIGNCADRYIIAAGEGNNGSKALKITNIHQVGSGTAKLFLTPKTSEFKLKNGGAFRVSFYAKVDQGSLAGVNFKATGNAWGVDKVDSPLNNGASISGTTYKQYSVDIVVPANGENYLALKFYQGNKATTTVWFDDIEIAPLSTVTLNKNNGEENTVLAGVSNTALTLPENPQKAGYNFTGWFTDAACTTPFVATTYPKQSITIYAGWTEAPKATVTFKQADGTLIDTKTGAVGEALNVTAPTKEGYYFSGWYKDTNFTDGYTNLVFPAKNTTLYAKYTQNGVLTQDFENFDNTSKLDTAHFSIYTADNENDPLVAQGKHSLKLVSQSGTYNVALTDSYSKLVKDKAYRLTFKVMATEVNSTVTLRFTMTNQRENSWGTGWNTNRLDPIYISKATNKWVEYSQIFYAKDEFYAITMYGDSTLYFDDFKIEPVDIVTVNFDSQGGSDVAPLTGPAGAAMTVANPTKEGKDFAGWFTDAACQHRFNASYYPAKSVTVYAKWVEKGVLEQDFEAWTLTGSSAERFSLYEAKNPEDPNVYSGSHSVYFENHALGENKILNLWDDSMGELTVNEKYTLSMKVKLDKTELGKYSTNGIFLQLWQTTQRKNGWAEAEGGRGAYMMYRALAFYVSPTFDESAYYNTANQTYTTTTRDENGWITVSYEFTAISNYLAILFSGGPCSLYVDDVTITPFPTGLKADNYSAPYCEEFYNELDGTGAIEAVNAGTKKIVELSLVKRGDYIFSASVKKGANLYLAWDAAGQNPIEGTTVTGTGDTYEMHALRFVPDQTGKVYLVSTGTGKDCCDYLALFLTKYGKEEDPEIRLTYKKVDYDNLAAADALAYTAGAAPVTDENNTDSETEAGTDGTTADTDSPATGDTNAALPVALVLFAAAGTVLATKRGKKHEH